MTSENSIPEITSSTPELNDSKDSIPIASDTETLANDSFQRLIELLSRSDLQPNEIFNEGTIKDLAYIKNLDSTKWGELHHRLKSRGFSTKNILNAIEESLFKDDPSDDDTYFMENGRMFWRRITADGITHIELCNFIAAITTEIIHDDGSDKKTIFYEISGTLSSGEKLPPAQVSAESFQSLKWVNEFWGAAACINAGSSIKDHLRAAIQLLSTDIKYKTIYTHLGWRQIDGLWNYLHAQGAINLDGLATDILVQPGDQRQINYALPTPLAEKEIKPAILQVLDFLKAGPAQLTYPIFSAVFSAPLHHILKHDFSLFLQGPSGAFKSEISAIAQSFFGKDFNRYTLPGGWHSTGNALERQAFLAKDTLFVVDDFSPQGSPTDRQRLHKEADRLLRGCGNQQGRSRLKSNATLQQTFHSRSLILSSGEDVPDGHSLRARMLILDIAPNDISSNALRQLQQYSAGGIYCQVMSSYIQWLSSRFNELSSSLQDKKLQFRQKAFQTITHRRTPDIIANLMIGAELFLDFSTSINAITAEESESHYSQFWSVLGEVSQNQKDYQTHEDPANRFIYFLKTAIKSGYAHIAEYHNDVPPKPEEIWGWYKTTIGTYKGNGDKIGWVDADVNELILNHHLAYKIAEKVAHDQNSLVGLSAKTLWKRLAQKGFLSIDPNKPRNLNRRTPEKGVDRTYYLVLKSADQFHTDATPIDIDDSITSKNISVPRKGVRRIVKPNVVVASKPTTLSALTESGLWKS